MLVFHGVNWGLVVQRGQSVGKILLKTRIVRVDGTAVGSCTA